MIVASQDAQNYTQLS